MMRCGTLLKVKNLNVTKRGVVHSQSASFASKGNKEFSSSKKGNKELPFSTFISSNAIKGKEIKKISFANFGLFPPRDFQRFIQPLFESRRYFSNTPEKKISEVPLGARTQIEVDKDKKPETPKSEKPKAEPLDKWSQVDVERWFNKTFPEYTGKVKGINGKALLSLTIDDIAREVTSGNRLAAASILNTIQELKKPQQEDIPTLIQKASKLKNRIETKVQYTEKWVQRPKLEEDIEKAVRKNVVAFNQSFQRSNDYRYLNISGGSGSGKTRTGTVVPTIMKSHNYGFPESTRVEAVHTLFFPSQSPFVDIYPPGYGPGKRPPRIPDAVVRGRELLALAVASQYFTGETSSAAQISLNRMSSKFSDLKIVIEMIRYEKKMDKNDVLILFPQLDEYQGSLYSTLNVLRAVSDEFKGICRSHNVLIIPILTGTAPASVEWSEENISATYYQATNIPIPTMDTETSRKMIALKVSDGKEESIYEDNPYFDALVYATGGIPKLNEFLATALKQRPSLENAEQATTIWKEIISDTMQQYRSETWIQTFHNTKALMELMQKAYFKDAVQRRTPLNGSNVGDVENSGLLFLQPVNDGANEFHITIAPILLHILDQSFKLGVFHEMLLNPFTHLNEETFPQYILNIHKATYSLLTWQGKAKKVKLSTIYRNAAIGTDNTLNTEIEVLPGATIYQCPEILSDNERYTAIDRTKVIVQTGLPSSKTKEIDTTDRKESYLIFTKRRGKAPDAILLHADEQYKFSAYLGSGIPIREPKDKTVFITPELLKKEKEKGQPGVTFALLSPKEYKGSIDALQDGEVLICGKQLLEFVRMFAAPFKLVK